MGYRLQHGESVTEGVRRICTEQIDKAARDLTDSGVDVHESVHRARKRFKKIRAVIRLVRPSLGDTYSQANAWFRDEARELSPIRDATALLETADRLDETFAEQVDEGFSQRVRDALVQRRRRLAEEGADPAALVDGLVTAIDQERDRIAGWTLDAEGFDAIGPGYAKTYGRGRKAVDRVHTDPTADNYHDLRKRVKYHRYHLRILRPLWPTVLKAHREEAHRLSDLLGDNQDLHVLHRALITEPELLDSVRDSQVLQGLLEQRQAELRSEVAPLARRVFAEKPKAATARMAVYWGEWAAGGE